MYYNVNLSKLHVIYLVHIGYTFGAHWVHIGCNLGVSYPTTPGFSNYPTFTFHTIYSNQNVFPIMSMHGRIIKYVNHSKNLKAALNARIYIIIDIIQ
jgi:hypothetical protein